VDCCHNHLLAGPDQIQTVIRHVLTGPNRVVLARHWEQWLAAQGYDTCDWHWNYACLIEQGACIEFWVRDAQLLTLLLLQQEP